MIEVTETIRQEEKFKTVSARYVSDGLNIYAFVNIPNDAGIHPVVVLLHGYSNPAYYKISQSNMTLENELARQGFITIHPAMRNYPPSDKGDNLFRVGQSIDVLNLIAIIKAQSGQPGLLQNADPNRIGLEGLSAGGGVVLRVLTISPDVKAAVLNSSISGDERRNVPLFHHIAANDPQFFGENKASESVLAQISPSSYFSSITAPILLTHGAYDRTIPLDFGKETCYLLQAANVHVTCNFYPEAGHMFSGANFENFVSQAIEFYRLHL